MWETKKLNQLCDIQSGLWKGKKEPFTEAYVLRNTNFTSGGKFNYSNVVALQVETKQLEKRLLLPNDIILEKSGGGEKTPVGRVCLHTSELDKPVSFSNFTARLRVLDEKELAPAFLHRFLYFLYISGKTKPMQRNSTGIRNLQITQYKEIAVPLPPIAEQQRIVAKLDAAFAMINKKTQTALEKIENTYLFQRNLLDAALRGVDATKHSYTLQQLLDTGWIVSHLDGNHGSDYPRKTEFIDKGVPYISANCIIEGNVVMGKAKYLSSDRAAQFRKGVARNGDILFAHNATVGPTAILKTKEEKVILGTSLTYFRCNDETISNEYLLAFMRSQQFIKQYNDVMGQATRNQVPITKQRTFTFLIPEIEVQHKVAKTAGTLTELTTEMVRLTEATIKELNALKAAILSQELQLSEAA